MVKPDAKLEFKVFNHYSIKSDVPLGTAKVSLASLLLENTGSSKYAFHFVQISRFFTIIFNKDSDNSNNGKVLDDVSLLISEPMNVKLTKCRISEEKERAYVSC